MNVLAVPFRQLVDRKLWPLAILLVVALAAVPVLLAKDDADVTPPPVVGGTVVASAEAAPAQPIVSLGAPAERESRRRVLGARKDPFEPKVKAKKAAAPATTTSSAGFAGTAPKSSGGSSVSPGGGSTAVAPSPVPVPFAEQPVPLAPKRTYELYTLRIRFGDTSSEHLAHRTIKRLTALPRMADPKLVYLGLKKDLKTAVFLVDAHTTVIGDGTCKPAPSDCQTVELRKGQTVFIDVLGDDGQTTEQYQLDMVSIIRKTTDDARAAKASRMREARGGRDALRANVSRVNGWKFDKRKGVLVRSSGR